MYDENQPQRLLRVLYELLATDDWIEFGELLRKFKVHEKTLRRDLSVIGRSLFTLMSEKRGRQRRIRVMECLYNPVSRLDEKRERKKRLHA